MSWKKVPRKNEESLEDLAGHFPQAYKRTMFGCPAWFINGNMFAAAHEENIIVRLAEKDREEALEEEGITPFAPMPGRAMREYVTLEPSLLSQRERLESWFEKAVDYVLTLPPKEKKRK